MILGTLVVLAACQTIVPSDTGGPGDATPVTDADTITPGDAVDPGDTTTTDGDAATEAGDLSERQIVIVRAARELVETQSTIVGETTFSYDCSGTILAVFAHAGIYLVDLFGSYTGNGVARLYGIATDYELLHKRVLPDPGDLIFWDNTYDRNEDGEWNDPLTHAGLVISVSDDGTVEYLHHNYRRGIVTARMNLLEPETYRNDEGGELNSPMRMASQRASNPDLWLSSHLFKEFASMHLIHIQTAITDGRKVVASRP
jgi:hypothetical protein